MGKRKRPERDESLAFVSSDALLAELLSRYDHAAFVGRQEPRVNSPACGISRVWKGDVYVVSGLAAEASRVCVDTARREAMKRRKRGGPMGGGT